MEKQLLRLGKGALVYGVGGILNRFITFLLLPLFTAYLTPADYGVSSILQLLILLTTSVFSLGLGVSLGICYFEGGDPNRKTATIWTGLTILLGSTLVLFVMGAVFAEPIGQGVLQMAGYGPFVVVSIASASLTILVQPLMLRLQFEERARLYVILSLAGTLVTIGLNVILVVFLRQGVWGLMLSNMLGQAITLFIFLIPAVNGLHFKWDEKVARDLVRLGLPMVPSFIVLFVMQQGNKYILQALRGLDEVGVYTIGFSLGMVMNLLVTAFQNAWTPFFLSFTEKKGEGAPLFGRIFTYYIYGFGVISLLFYLAARPVVMVMTTPAFHDAFKVVGLSASAQFFMGAFLALLPGIYFARQVKHIIFIQALPALLAVTINLLLIPSLGLVGAGLAQALSFLSLAAILFFWNRWRGYLEVPYEWKRVGVFAIIYLPVAAFTLWSPAWSLWMVAAMNTVLTLVLVSGVYFLLSAPEKKALWNIIKGLRQAMHRAFVHSKQEYPE